MSRTRRARDLFGVATRTGMLDPRRLPGLGAGVGRWGASLAAPFAATALTAPNRTAVIDHRGSISYAQLDRRSTRLAGGLRSLGLGRGDQLGVLCRNHRSMVEVTLAAAKASLVPVYLNTGSAGPQLGEVLQREDVAALVVDTELAHLAEAASFTGPVILANTTGPDPDGRTTLHDLRRTRSVRPLLPAAPIAPVLLTSGTTGIPKGARRSMTSDPSGAVGLLERIPYRHDDNILVTSPLFHAWGLAQMGLAISLGATLVLAPTFDPANTLHLINRHNVTVLAVVPVLLQRLLQAPECADADLSSLRIVASSGSALPAPVVEAWLDRAGPNLYNLYGSTEVGQATLAQPADLLEHTTTAGRALPGSVVKILGPSGAVLPAGQTGRIFVGNSAQFDHYTGGGTKEMVDGLMASGDVGHLDEDGLLFVTGRADDMIISGGENVFPEEVESVLLRHPGVADAAVVGVDDTEFGQRLVAFVVKQPGKKATGKQLRSHVRDQLASYKVPRDITFVDSLSRTTTGKLRRNHIASTV